MDSFRAGHWPVLGPIAAAVAALAVALAVGCRPAAPGPGEEAVVVVSSCSLWLMAPDGRQQSRLLASRGYLSDPAWSPDGRQVAYVARPDRLCLVHVTSRREQPLVSGVAEDVRWPRWSPDGKQLAFMGDGRLYTIAAAPGAQPAPRTPPGWGALYSGDAPAWSPDGTHLAVAAGRPGKSAIYVTAAGDGALRRIVLKGDNRSPAWSPDGAWIAFASERSGATNLYVVRPDGHDEQALTQGPGTDMDPVWSPDGKRVVFSRRLTRPTKGGSPGTTGVWVVEVSTRREHALTPGSRWDGHATWSPDGERVVFVSYRDAPARRTPSPYAEDADRTQLELYTVRRDGTGLQRLTRNRTEEDFPVWWGPGATEHDKAGRLPP